MSLVDDLRKWEPLELAKTLAQHAHENAALRDRVHELEHELFWMHAAENEATRRAGAREAALQDELSRAWAERDRLAVLNGDCLALLAAAPEEKPAALPAGTKFGG